MTTRIEVIDAALVSLGAQPLQVETARGAANRIREYRTLLTGLLATYPWWWATPVTPLARLAGVAVGTGYGLRYGLPVDMLGGPRAAYDDAGCRRPFHAWRLVAAARADEPAELHTDAAAVWLRYTRDVPPQFWPGYFHALFVEALAAQYALSVREDRPLADALKAAVYGTPGQLGEGGRMAMAKAADSQSQPARTLVMGDNPLIDARR